MVIIGMLILKPISYIYTTMPSIKYIKNKECVLRWNAKNMDRVRELARKYKNNKYNYRRELTAFYMIGLN